MELVWDYFDALLKIKSPQIYLQALVEENDRLQIIFGLSLSSHQYSYQSVSCIVPNIFCDVLV